MAAEENDNKEFNQGFFGFSAGLFINLRTYHFDKLFVKLSLGKLHSTALLAWQRGLGQESGTTAVYQLVAASDEPGMKINEKKIYNL